MEQRHHDTELFEGAERKALEIRATELETLVTELEEQMHERGARISELENDITSLSSQLEDTESQLFESEQQNEALTQAVHALTQQVEKERALQTELQTQLHEKSREMLRLESEYRDLAIQHDELQDTMHSHVAMANDLSKEEVSGLSDQTLLANFAFSAFFVVVVVDRFFICVMLFVFRFVLTVN
jgi:chromosome segregation ATPase